MESNKEIIRDLKNVLAIINDGKEGYESSSKATDNIDLKGVFLNYAAQRALFADELKAHIALHGGDAGNESGGVLGSMHRTWIDVKQALSSKEDKAILDAVVTGETVALQTYNRYIADYSDHADHLELLRRQRDGIQDAIKEMHTLLSARQH
jgi:uncharacterized protein (TIGR02284 family)